VKIQDFFINHINVLKLQHYKGLLKVIINK